MRATRLFLLQTALPCLLFYGIYDDLSSTRTKTAQEPNNTQSSKISGTQFNANIEGALSDLLLFLSNCQQQNLNTLVYNCGMIKAKIFSKG